MRFPKRIICLSAESADWLARLGAWERVVGVTSFYEPPRELAPRPRIAGFSTAQLDAIVALHPDLVLGFSDVQAAVAAELVRRGLTVVVTNQRTIDELFDALELIARAVDRAAAAEPLLVQLRADLAAVEPPPRRPRVYFEEWHDPPVSGICWVSELIERAGGEDVFAEFRNRAAAADRAVTTSAIVAAAPEIMIASWCGKPVDWQRVRKRPGWNSLSCVQAGQLYEIPSNQILQPGFGLAAGYAQIRSIVGGGATAIATATVRQLSLS
ncbi:MAG: cobalamin-binding protein [Planctomycetes bacterium]|nr:cobalamin-binding protein [Planctomycetota bacterium]